MRHAAVLVLACLAGCATTGSLEGHANRVERASKKLPPEAANCVARNAERIWPGLNMQASASVRPGQKPGTFEVAHTSLGDAVSLTVVSPEDSGSRMVVWYRWQPMIDFTSIPQRLLDGC